MITLIVAASKNNVIGNKGEIPWYLPRDLKHFANLTRGHRVVMGRKTFESIMKRLGHPLPDRETFIITRNEKFEAPPGCVITPSWEEALKLLGEEDGKEVFVIGGETVYEVALPYADRLYLTRVLMSCPGDTFLPEINFNHWEKVAEEFHPRDEKNKYDLTFYTYKRREGKLKNPFINMKSIRRADQRQVMEEIETRGHCPFCPENLNKYHKKPIIAEGKFWLLTDNQWPYDKVKQQLLAIHKTHIEHVNDLEPGAAQELFDLFTTEAKKRNIGGGGIAIRFGKSPDGSYGSSVLHLHAHLIEPDLAALEAHEAWRFKFGQPKDYRSPKLDKPGQK